MPGGTNTISNSSTFTGWLESTGLDELLINPCACIFGEEPPPPPLPGERRRPQTTGRGGRGAQQTVVVEEPEPSSMFSWAALFGSTTSATSVQSTHLVQNTEPKGPASLAFWQQRSMTLLELYTDQGEPSEKCGDLNFSLDYDFNTQTLRLKIIQGRDLAARDTNGLSDPYEKLGEILLSLTYLPSTNTLSIQIIKARNLKAKDINGKSDPYVKIWLFFGEKRVDKKKTPIYKCNLNPTFNTTFEFDVPWEQIRDCSLEISVMDFDTIGRNELIGKLMLGARNGSGPRETAQWGDMIAKPRQSSVVWHRLKPGE
ncbi:synaptotagmin-2 [Eurytemora carolleeae]|uniref:synaptotagmin-2 n=1 Tax=Eurytemora carolleeae TaxID=1294199 RepID=UPI000C788B2B|nr:synaptotagmin-2 [Eurytemora carolleeae]|eukprot:XP_023327507.1 synaptotagmin-2-like [Eurytemora affinis]